MRVRMLFMGSVHVDELRVCVVCVREMILGSSSPASDWHQFITVKYFIFSIFSESFLPYLETLIILKTFTL